MSYDKLVMRDGRILFISQLEAEFHRILVALATVDRAETERVVGSWTHNHEHIRIELHNPFLSNPNARPEDEQNK